MDTDPFYHAILGQSMDGDTHLIESKSSRCKLCVAMLKKVLIVELDHRYAVCGLKNFSNGVVLDHGCKRYAVCEPYGRMHARTHRQN